MSDENQIGLAELLIQIKKELLEASSLCLFKVQGKDVSLQPTDIPLFAYSNIELELQVTVKKEVSAGVKTGSAIKLWVDADVKGGGSRDDVQKIKITLEPLFTKQQLLKMLEEQNPNLLKYMKRIVPYATTKGNSNGNLDDNI